MKAFLLRLHFSKKQTLGLLQFFEGTGKIFECKTMELPWKNNAPYVSCIPAGIYKVKKHDSPKFGRSFHVLNVQNRSEILIHRGNYNRDTLGCILPGMDFKDIDNDGLKDVKSSAVAMEHLWDVAPDEFTLTVSS